MIKFENEEPRKATDDELRHIFEGSIARQSNMLDMMKDCFNRAFRSYDNQIKSHIMQSLNNLGYSFENDEDFTKFSHERLTKAIEEGNPDDIYLFLDYETENEKMIGRYNTKVISNLDKHGWTITFG